jgi:archaellum biogenesis protein FlaJ (TadC family)
MIEWIQSNETIVWWLVASSAFTFLASLILVPMFVVRIPADYFAHKKRHHKRPEKYPPVIRLIVLVIKNVLGLILFCAGILMLVLPGQGLFTVERGPILKSINWLRRRAGHDPLRTCADGSPPPADC